MASTSEAGPSTSVTVGFIASGGNVRIGNVNINNNNNEVDEFALPRPIDIDTFHGRDVEMRKLDEAFFSEESKNKVVICGTGGFGKSELSKIYADQCLANERVHRVVWIDSEDPDKLKESFKKLRPIYKNFADEQLLIIFDNCTSQQSIADYEPKKNQNHRVLITCQSAEWRSDIPKIILEPLSRNHALQVFRSVLGDKYRDENEDLYASLASLVSFIPLGLQVVASYVEQGDDDFNLTEYVNEIKNSEHDIINKPIEDCAGTSYTKSIYGAMITSVRKIEKKQDQNLAHDVLCFTAYLNPDRIETKDLLCVVKMINNKYQETKLKLALNLLSKFSFLRYGDDKKSFVVQHRITQAFVRNYIVNNISNLKYNYYKMCLECAIKEDRFSNCIKYADSNVTIVHKFYKDNHMHEKIDMFLKNLIRCACIECIKQIFDEQTKKHISQYNLLAICASTDNEEILQVLLFHVDINSKNDSQDTALHVLAKGKDLKGINFLVRHGADVNVFNADGDPPLFLIIHNNNSSERYDWDDIFKQFKADFNLKNSKNQTLLHAAATGQQTELVDFLLENGLQLNQRDNNGWTPLDSLYRHISKLFDTYKSLEINIQMLKKLLTLDATSTNDIEHKNSRDDSCGFLLLNYSLKRNDLNLLEFLLEKGVYVNSLNRYNRTVLHRCAKIMNLKATEIVIKHKDVDCNVEDCKGNTPLFHFIKNIKFNSNMDNVKHMLDLLQYNSEHVDSSGNTVLDVATSRRYVELVEMLIERQNLKGDTYNS